MLRTHTCGELNSTHINQEVTICGRVNKNRNLWGLDFIDLRDRYGITQITINPDKDLDFKWDISSIKHEYVLQITAKVIARPENMINTNISTGEIELQPIKIRILSKSSELPFVIADDPKSSEQTRFKYRYLDIRRKKIMDNIQFRADMNSFTRNRFHQNGFLEIQTPIFTVSSPEWARDYLIPSRVNPGKFYALPQAPQQYKQLLMVGWIDKYFQIAPCFRDEDPRADRHSCEFYQIDCEMSFVEKEDIYNTVETYIKELISKLSSHKTITVDFSKIKYAEAIDLYGSDKPDLRFNMKFVDFTQDFKTSNFCVFKNTAISGGSIKAINLKWQLLSRKQIDERTKKAIEYWAKWLAYIKIWEEWPQSPITKFFSEEELQNIANKLDAKIWDTLLFVADTYATTTDVLWKLRKDIWTHFNLTDKDTLWFVRVEDFPMFELNSEKDWELDFAHNPFSYIKGGVEALNNTDPLQLETTQYDLALNWYEILSGSIRNHDKEVLLKVFQLAGMNEEDIKKKFGAIYEAFQYWPPPHGGFAIWFDRLLMILRDEPNIRECYAFPKSWKAEDIMMWAPAAVDTKLLEDLQIKVELKKETNLKNKE